MVQWTAQQIEAALGPIDLLINNAGVLEPLGKQFFIDQKETGKVLAPEFPAQIITWLCSTDCDVESGAVINLRNQPELLARIDRAWG